jgi:hypothetical protein
MEIPKALWLKNNMPPELFAKCKFYDLTDALTHLATGNEARSFCSTVCKQGYVPVGVDGSEKGWQEDFFETIGLGDLAKDNFERMGGVNGVVSDKSDSMHATLPLGTATLHPPPLPLGLARFPAFNNHSRGTRSIPQLATRGAIVGNGDKGQSRPGGQGTVNCC